MDDKYFRDRTVEIIKKHGFKNNDYKELWDRLYDAFQRKHGKIITEKNEIPIDAIFREGRIVQLCAIAEKLNREELIAHKHMIKQIKEEQKRIKDEQERNARKLLEEKKKVVTMDDFMGMFSKIKK